MKQNRIMSEDVPGIVLVTSSGTPRRVLRTICFQNILILLLFQLQKH